MLLQRCFLNQPKLDVPSFRTSWTEGPQGASGSVPIECLRGSGASRARCATTVAGQKQPGARRPPRLVLPVWLAWPCSSDEHPVLPTLRKGSQVRSLFQDEQISELVLPRCLVVFACSGLGPVSPSAQPQSLPGAVPGKAMAWSWQARAPGMLCSEGLGVCVCEFFFFGGTKTPQKRRQNQGGVVLQHPPRVVHWYPSGTNGPSLEGAFF